ncbi:MAG TPA: hypothetical protein PK771_10345 [Spirochaetota bacterium]|nr:hypothetical protein [Spirochaetota bacterium]
MKKSCVLIWLLGLLFSLYAEDADFKKVYLDAKLKHENEYPVFSQKGGMLRPLDHSFYFRTDDEWTGFSTIYLGYRFAPAEYFNFAIEGGVGLPQLYQANILLHFKIYETPNKFFFMGLRARGGYMYRHADKSMFFVGVNNESGYMGFGKDYYTIENRHSIYFATDLTVALRFGKYKEQCVYYTIYPKFDFDLFGGPTYILFAPVMTGYEVRFGKFMEWSFAAEFGYAFPLPWGSVPDGKWINFPSLANVGLHYRFGDKFYSDLYKKHNKKFFDKL